MQQEATPRPPAELKPLLLGPLRIWPPVVLAPMAGVTNHPFRTLCRRFGAGLYVSEMITARALVEGNDKTWRLASFGPEEATRSLQLCGVDPGSVGRAVGRLVAASEVDHIDLNFGCPVRKVTRKGGGAAIPLKPRLLRNIVSSAVRAAGSVPVSIKVRIGIDERYRTFLEAGRIAQEEGCAAVGLHARTAAQLYDGPACWEAITELKSALRHIPVLGNGDIWEAEDALRMMHETGCDGVIVGRGCLGRPWLFRDLADVFEGRVPSDPPNFGVVKEIAQEHARLLCEWLGEAAAMRAFRKHSIWYTKGFHRAASVRPQLMLVNTLEQLSLVLGSLDASEPFPPGAAHLPRGKRGGRQRVVLPPGYLEQLDDATPPEAEAEAAVSGG
ncbi:MAG: tRNA dihydrouridine synthase DusB [Proteobacteria bacterium]|nr:tRNA dihydrouridine synthase DusB [Pseudomonadota bacterium]